MLLPFDPGGTCPGVGGCMNDELSSNPDHKFSYCVVLLTYSTEPPLLQFSLEHRALCTLNSLMHVRFKRLEF